MDDPLYIANTEESVQDERKCISCGITWNAHLFMYAEPLIISPDEILCFRCRDMRADPIQ